MEFNSGFKGLNDIIVVLLIMFVLRLRLRCRDILCMDHLLYRGSCCEWNHCNCRILHYLVRCGVEVLWFCFRTRIVCLWSLLSFVIHSFAMRFTGSYHNWFMAALITLVM